MRTAKRLLRWLFYPKRCPYFRCRRRAVEVKVVALWPVHRAWFCGGCGWYWDIEWRKPGVQG